MARRRVDLFTATSERHRFVHHDVLCVVLFVAGAGDGTFWRTGRLHQHHVHGSHVSGFGTMGMGGRFS